MAPEAYPRESHAYQVARLLDRYQPILGLADWDIRFDPAPPAEGARAEIDGWAVKRLASIRIAPDAPVDALPRLVVHELLHMWLSQLQDLVRPSQAFTPPQVDDAFVTAWDRLEHQLIHVLEGALTGDAHMEWGDGPAWTAPWRRDVGTAGHDGGAVYVVCRLRMIPTSGDETRFIPADDGPFDLWSHKGRPLSEGLMRRAMWVAPVTGGYVAVAKPCGFSAVRREDGAST